MTIAVALLDTAVNGISPRTFGRTNSDGKNSSNEPDIVSINPSKNARSMLVGRRTAAQMILSHDSDENSRRSADRQSPRGERQGFRAGYHKDLLGREILRMPVMISSSRTETGYEIPGLIGRPSWILCEKVALQFPGREGDDFDFDEEGGWSDSAERLLGCRHDATALQRFERNPIAKSLPPPSFLASHPFDARTREWAYGPKDS